MRMSRIIEEHRQLVDAKMQELQDSLTTRIQKFEDDLSVYARMVDELQNNGNIDDLPKYHKKATQLDNRLLLFLIQNSSFWLRFRVKSSLITAMERIDQFNEEEACFKFELSQYPLRKQIHDKLTPYKKLYDNAVDFLTKYDLWMNSQVGSFDPEEIDTDVGTYYRQIYKLEKVFADRPASLGLAATVIPITQSFFFCFYETNLSHRCGNKSRNLKLACP